MVSGDEFCWQRCGRIPLEPGGLGFPSDAVLLKLLALVNPVSIADITAVKNLLSPLPGRVIVEEIQIRCVAVKASVVRARNQPKGYFIVAGNGDTRIEPGPARCATCFFSWEILSWPCGECSNFVSNSESVCAVFFMRCQ